MVFTFEFRVIKDEITPFLRDKLPKLPEALGDAGNEIARVAQRNLRREISRQDLKWSGNLWTKTEARRLSKFRSVVFVPRYGIWLDSQMPTKPVPLFNRSGRMRGGKTLGGWVRTSHKSPWQGLAPRFIPMRFLKVKNHPWIDRPVDMAIARSTQIMQKHVNKIR